MRFLEAFAFNLIVDVLTALKGLAADEQRSWQTRTGASIEGAG